MSADAFAAFAAALGPALTRAAQADGRRAVPVSLALEVVAPGGLAPGEAATVSAAVERATRTLVFVAGEARGPDGRLLAAASAVYRLDAA